MATYEFDDLREKYAQFQHPVAVVKINDVSLADGKKGYPVSDIQIDLTSGFEASVAEFSLYDVYDESAGKFDFPKEKAKILLGSKADVYLGYSGSAKCVFIGVITRVNYLFEKGDVPCVRVTAMDVKGVMMAGNYSAQLKADNYADAVKEILDKTAYEKLGPQGMKVMTGIRVDATPDKQRAMTGSAQGVSDKTIEMVAESDYEFVVKAAKKNNFEFFTECGQVYFRKAKSDTSVLMEIGPSTGMHSFDISYDLTGLVEKVVVRGMDVSKAKVITANKKFSNKISGGNKAKPLLKNSRKVYIDSTISSKEEAEDRAESLMETMSYRYGTLECELVGLPELLPGHFISLSGLGDDLENKFYVVRIRHILGKDGQFDTRVTAVSAAIEDGGAGSLTGSTGLGGLL
ncbi:MAG: hypothetical protein J6C33_00335 [Lachnospiraceae bacterium]|nr:hypothetical protein [Lachnospiraceae bacterium]